MLDFIAKLASTDGFMPHGHCYLWAPGPFWLTVLSESVIALAYFGIPFLLMAYTRRRPELRHGEMLGWFAAFILLCGISHVFSIVGMWQPLYRLEGVILLATAIVSVVTTIKLGFLIPKLVAIPTPEEYRATKQSLTRANKLSERALRANRLKSRFLANTSHEIRTPLHGVIGTLELLQLKERDEDDAKLLRVARHSADMLLALINDVLDLSKIEAGRLVLAEELVDLSEIVDRAVDVLRPLANEKKLALRTYLDSTTPVLIKADRARVTQILVNLISNAVKFTEQGSVEVRAFTQERRDDQVFVVFEVEDSGVGIAPENVETIFEPFTQESAFTHRKFGGTGLGLTISRHLAMAMDGDIDVENNPGKGATFRVFLKVTAASAAEEKAFYAGRSSVEDSVDLLDASSFPLRILVVEDLDNNRVIVSKILRGRGHQVEFAGSVAEGVRKEAENRYDAILMDVRLPDGSGFEATRLIRETTTNRELVVMGLSAQTLPEDVEQSRAVGMDAYLKKPVSGSEIVSTVERLCSNAGGSKAKPLNRKPQSLLDHRN